MHIQNFDPYDFSKKEVNGVPIYYKNLPWAPCIHIQFLFSAGAFSDPLGKEGLAHFLEHILGNGCPLIPDKKAMKEFSRLYMLDSRNAFTSPYRTTYVGKCLPEHFPKVVATMKDYVFSSFLRSEDVEHERKVITQEAWGRFKNNKLLEYIKEYSRNIYHGHHKERFFSPLGWPTSIASITQGDLKKFYVEKYVKENLTILLVGAVEDKNVSVLSTILTDLPSGVENVLTDGTIGKPLVSRFERTGEEIGDPHEQAEFTISRSMHEVNKEEDEIGNQAAGLLYDILFERLRVEHSLCYGVSVSWRSNKDYLEAGISVNTSEDKIGLVEREIWNVIHEVLEGKWKDRFSTLHTLVLDQIRSREWVSDMIMGFASNDLVNSGRIIPLKEIELDAEKVTYEKITAIVKKVFDPEYIFTEVILPTKK